MEPWRPGGRSGFRRARGSIAVTHARGLVAKRETPGEVPGVDVLSAFNGGSMATKTTARTGWPTNTVSAEYMKALRAKAGHTLREAAMAVHQPERSWANYETGRSKAPLAIAELYALKTGQDFDPTK